MSPTDLVDARGRSQAIAAFMAVSPRAGATHDGDISRDLFPVDFPEPEIWFRSGIILHAGLTSGLR